MPKLTRGEVRISKMYEDLVELQDEVFEQQPNVDEETLYASRLLVKEFKRLYDPQEIK
jgi:hypothetical protein